MVFNATFNNMSVISWRSVLLVEETPSKKTPTCCKSDKPYHIMLYRVHLTRAGFELTMLVVASTDCIGSYNVDHREILVAIYYSRVISEHWLVQTPGFTSNQTTFVLKNKVSLQINIKGEELVVAIWGLSTITSIKPNKYKQIIKEDIFRLLINSNKV